MKKINLDNITIVSINTRDPENSIKAIERSSKYIQFAKCLLFSDNILEHKYIETIKIPKIKSLEEYNYFCIKELFKYIDTDFCLMVQPDGFVINPLMWSNDFLNYDYIGAPWDEIRSIMALNYAKIDYTKIKKIPYIVGNGGFSLRSKKLLIECSKLEYDFIIPEDVFITSNSRKTLIDNGIIFAPLNIACRFSIEHILHNNEKILNLDSYFGFHGIHEFKKPLLDLLDNYEKDIPSIELLKQFDFDKK